jgi:transcriptional regulator with XRE-family HTH domain
MANFQDLLKQWRSARRFSQLNLALEANVSSRHISFLETGRAAPSRAMVLRLGEVLSLPLAARNQMLLSAGFAQHYPARAWSDAALAPIRKAVSHILSAHAPFPAFAIDHAWTILEMNAAAQQLFGVLGMAKGVNILALLMTGEIASYVENWPEVASHIARRLHLESAHQGGQAYFDHVAATLNTQATTPTANSHSLNTTPVVPIIMRAHTRRLSLFLTLTQFASADDLCLDGLKMELYFPADDASEQILRAMAL